MAKLTYDLKPFFYPEGQVVDIRQGNIEDKTMPLHITTEFWPALRTDKGQDVPARWRFSIYPTTAFSSPALVRSLGSVSGAQLLGRGQRLESWVVQASKSENAFADLVEKMFDAGMFVKALMQQQAIARTIYTHIEQAHACFQWLVEIESMRTSSADSTKKAVRAVSQQRPDAIPYFKYTH